MNSTTAITQDSRTVLTDFHMTILLIRLIQQASLDRDGENASLLKHKPGVPQVRSPWHLYLDQLSHLCQFQKAEAVVSIAVQDTGLSNIMWLALTKGSMSRPVERLENILESLKVAANLDRSRDSHLLEARANWIADESIMRSSERVSNYGRNLRNNLRALLASSGREVEEEEENCIQTIHTLLGLQDNHLQLCREAFKFRKSRAHQFLRLKLKTTSESIWQLIYHNIGRLGSWYQAAWFVVLHASQFAKVLNCKVQSVPRSALPLSNNAVAMDKDLEALLSSVCPTIRDSTVLKTAAARMSNSKVVLEKLRQNKKPPRIHVEVEVLHMFISNNFRFANNDPYIGCSKPSCYCCSLYFERHPQIAKRPTHGRAYVDWWMPGFPTDDKISVDQKIVTMLRKMSTKAQEESVKDILGCKFGSKRLFDSTTGLSASLKMLMNEARR